MKSIKILLSLGLILCSVVSLAKNKIELEPEIKSSYLQLLNQATDFHKALKKGDKKIIQEEVKEIQEVIAQVYQKTLSMPKFHQRIHSQKLLSNIEEQLIGLNSERTVNQSPNKKNIKKLFHSLFELAQVYDLSKEMKAQMFYCRKDKSLWIQSDSTVHNPISAKHAKCGKALL